MLAAAVKICHYYSDQASRKKSLLLSPEPYLIWRFSFNQFSLSSEGLLMYFSSVCACQHLQMWSHRSELSVSALFWHCTHHCQCHSVSLSFLCDFCNSFFWLWFLIPFQSALQFNQQCSLPGSIITENEQGIRNNHCTLLLPSLS